jgi:hypothetical protein
MAGVKSDESYPTLFSSLSEKWSPVEGRLGRELNCIVFSSLVRYIDEFMLCVFDNSYRS